ncbi:NUDIX hydrolase [Zavarzinia sp. CC-PAN008]|uniref:NUDIX hydrolase n=1 Tax=Zavarzinia sp. CC-PAN008 TaxID=3243332 RepID=UPI003F748F17
MSQTDNAAPPKSDPRGLMPAATVLLLRDGAQGLEVFMVQRHHQIDFASGALVFPGGKIDKTDSDPRLRARAPEGSHLDDTTFAMRVAAIREAFEECGVLLARPAGEAQLIAASRLDAFDDTWRPRLAKGECGIMDLLEAEDLNLAVDLLVPFAHWITPTMMPKRFDTHFYLAVAPHDHVLLHDGEESVDGLWITPQAALDDAKAKRRTVIFPTRQNLWKLGRCASVDEAVRTASSTPIVTVLPEMRTIDGEQFLCIPAEAGYEVTQASVKDGL